MRHRFLGTAPLALSLALSFAGPSLAFVPHEDHSALEFPLEYDAVRVIFESEILDDTHDFRSPSVRPGWTVERNPRTGYIHSAYGPGLSVGPIADETSAAAAARDFLLANPEALGTEPGSLELRNVKHARGKYAVHYGQVVDGTPVWQASAFVLLGEAGEVMAYGSDFFPRYRETIEAATLSASDAIARATAALGATPRAGRPIDADPYLVPAPSGELMALTRAWRVVFETDEPFGMWASFVDARSGRILSRENLYHEVNVSGNSNADVQFHGYCDGVSDLPMANLTVEVSGGNSDDTDANGDFSISHGGVSAVGLDAELRGPFIDVNRFTGLGADASWSDTVNPGIPVQVTWDGSNSRQDERDCFHNANLAHDFVKALEPSFTGLDFSMATWVGRTDGFCPGNAWWSPGESSINFCEAGGGYANTGEIGNVVYHEYGHGASQYVYAANGGSLPSGDMHEGNADILANYIDRNPVIGYGFSTCATGIRNADNALQWPVDNDGGHSGGQIIAGFAWDSWQSLLGAMPQAEADSIAWHTWHFARVMGIPTTQPSQVLWTFMADDDDADLTNGTPNYDHLCVGAANHNFNCPTVTAGVFVTHSNPIATNTDGSLGFDVDAIITSTEAPLDPSQLLVRYRVNGGSFTDLVMTATGTPDEYSAHIPALDQTSEVEYYVTATDMGGNTQESPATAPGALHAFDVAFLHDDLESGSGGWTAGVVGDDATTGQWGLFDPIGTAAQPEDDSTPDPGTDCFITGQCSGTNCGGGCTLGCNDIDNGTTTLLSPVYDLNGAVTAKLKYDRWYSNNTGAAPGEDSWVVDVSNDGGSSWTNVENTQDSSAKWITMSIDLAALFGAPDQVQVRFRASDLINGSLVEAAVDELRILADFDGVVGVDPSQSTHPAALTLAQSQPNPFRASARIEYGVPSRSDVDLTVYNVNGQAIRTLASGPRAAGSYKVNWDGRDTSGQRVAAGVYFYRLTAAGESITRKMTVLK